MVKTVLLYSGKKEALFFSDIFSTENHKLADSGIFYPDFSHVVFPGTINQNGLTLLTDDTSPQLVARRLTANTKQSQIFTTLCQTKKQAHARGAHTLILGFSTFRPFYAKVCDLLMACRMVFPEAAHQLFVDITDRDDTMLESTCTQRCLHLADESADLLLALWIKRCVNNFGDILRDMFRLFGRDHVHCGDASTAINLLRQQGLTGSLVHTPLYPRILPREIIHFSQATLLWRSPPIPADTVIHWGTQIHRFTPENGYAPGPSLLGPARRAGLLERCRVGNTEAAQLLGLDRLFDDPQPEPDWQPFLGLDAATAFNIAQHLDMDFAQARMAELDAIPAHFLQHDQRLVQQALHDVCNKTASPLPFGISLAPEPLLSVLTLTYNHAEFIARNIESVIAQQTSFPMQHIIADDGSTDGTQKIILDYAARYPHIVPVFRKDRNTAGWRNVQALFDMCRTEYAALCDGDDYFTDPAKLQIQVDFLDQHKDCALCFHPVRVVYEDGSKQERIYPPVEQLPRGIKPFYYLSDLLKCNLIQTNSVVYRWRFRNGLPEWFRPDCCPGDWYWHLLHAELGKIGFINKIMSVYRRHKKGIYYLSEVDRLKHRATVGQKEIEVYDIINRHFDNKYKSILLDLVNGVFADCLMYDSSREQDDEFKPVLPMLVEKYPDFARHFLESLKLVSAKSNPVA